MKKVLMPIALIGLMSCTSTTDKTCSCIREATNNAIVEGTELSEDDLIALCVESKEALKKLSLEEKSTVTKCVDSALNLIPIKTLFPEKDQRELPAIKDSKEIESKIIACKNRYNGQQVVLNKAGYYFLKRPMNARFIVDTKERDLMTEEVIIKDGKFEVIGMLLEGSNLNKNLQVRLRMPVSALTDVKESTHALFEDDQYNQFIDFHGICSQFAVTAGGQFSLTFDVDKYKATNKPEAKLVQQPSIVKDTANTELEVNQTTTSPTGIVNVDKAYFFSEPSLDKKRKGYLIKNQQVAIGEVKGDFIFCIYDNNGQKTTGWMLKNEIQ